jgi:hypothetical protein
VTLEARRWWGERPPHWSDGCTSRPKNQGRELRYTHGADPELADLGLIARAQRAGDLVLSRPGMLDQRAEVTWDYVPSREWTVY